jgi:linoleate 10R-lipoxygenase
MGIRHACELGVCTLNELRKLCNLRPYRTFEEMNDDEASHCYCSEGIIWRHRERRTISRPGCRTGQTTTRSHRLRAGCTITYAILSDAVALVRGDQFLTTELSPYNLTQWGYDETQADNRWSFGNVLGDKLLNPHLGEENVPRDSEETRRNIKKFGMENVYRETRV